MAKAQGKYIPKFSSVIERQTERQTTALLIIDMQNDLYHPDGFFGCRAREGLPAYLGYDFEFERAAIPHIKRLAQAMRELGVPVIYCENAFERDFSDVGIPQFAAEPEAKELGLFIKGTWGAQTIDELKPQPGDYVIEAKTFSKFPYSPLELILRNKGIKTLIFTGGSSAVCVEGTLRDAVTLRFQCIMTSDGTIAKDRPTHEVALERIKRYFGMVMTSDEVIKLLTESKSGSQQKE